MTKEKLDELEALARDLKDRTANLWAAAGMDALTPRAPQAADLLLRLLEERKRLLEALRPFAEGADAMTFRKMMYEAGLEHVVKQTAAAAAAIAFAEAPAD